MRILPGTRNRTFMVFFMTIVYRCLLDLVYCVYASRIFSYVGLTYEYNPVKILISWILLFLGFPTAKRCIVQAKFSNIIVFFLIYLSYVPFTTMVAFFGYQYRFIAVNSVYWLVFFLVFNHLPRLRGSFDISTNVNDRLLSGIEIFFAITIIFISWRYTGFRFTLGLSDVYAYRAEARMASMPTILGYIFSASKAINPVLLVYFIHRKKKYQAALVVFVQILSFSVNGSKTVLFSTLFAVAFYFLYNDSFLKKIPLLMSGLGLLTYLESALLGTNFLLAYFVRRVLFVPNQLGAYYYDFFSKNPPDYYKQGFLRLFGAKSQYTAIDNLIGEKYFGKPNMGANSGLISDAVANFGLAGIVIMPIILVLILRILDKCAEGVDKRLYISTSIVIAFIFISSFLPTVLLTHGLIALGIVLMMMPRKKNEPESEILNIWS